MQQSTAKGSVLVLALISAQRAGNSSTLQPIPGPDRLDNGMVWGSGNLEGSGQFGTVPGLHGPGCNLQGESEWHPSLTALFLCGAVNTRPHHHSFDKAIDGERVAFAFAEVNCEKLRVRINRIELPEKNGYNVEGCPKIGDLGTNHF